MLYTKVASSSLLLCVQAPGASPTGALAWGWCMVYSAWALWFGNGAHYKGGVLKKQNNQTQALEYKQLVGWRYPATQRPSVAVLALLLKLRC